MINAYKIFFYFQLEVFFPERVTTLALIVDIFVFKCKLKKRNGWKMNGMLEIILS